MLMRDKVGSVVSEDGKVSSRGFQETVVLALEEDEPRMLPVTGSCAAQPAEMHFLFDSFPITGFSLTHICIANASRTDSAAHMSEAELRCVAITTLGDNNAGINAVVRENKIAADFNNIRRDQGCCARGRFQYVQLTIGADKKGVEGLRGCGPSNPWVWSCRERQHKLPWEHDADPPETWAEFQALWKKIYPEGIIDEASIHELSHAVAGKYCRGCKKVPYATEAARLAAKKRLMQLASSDNKADIGAYKKKRKEYSESHFYQHEFAELELEFDMKEVIPELLHADSLNIAKLLFKWLLLKLSDAHCRERLVAFFGGLDARIDLRKKTDGRQRSDKWWRASVWDCLVAGTQKRPGGLAAWLPTVIFIILHSHVTGRAQVSCAEEIAQHKPEKVAAPAASARDRPRAIRKDSSDEDECDEENGAGPSAPESANRLESALRHE